jgi:membrane-associated phospholipid phosphatase
MGRQRGFWVASLGRLAAVVGLLTALTGPSRAETLEEPAGSAAESPAATEPAASTKAPDPPARALGATAGAAPAPDRQQPTVAWNPAWPKFRLVELGLTATLIAADIAIVELVPDPPPNWRASLLFDRPVLNWLVADTPEARSRAQDYSNYFHSGTFLFGLLEAPAAAGVIHGRWDVALELSLMNAEAFAAAGFVQLLTARLVGRERPYTERCQPGETGFPCNEGGSTLSFGSGHVMTSYVAAGLVCAHHARLPLWGGGAPDAIACGLALASGTTTGILRIAAEKHYPTDVTLGMLLGFGFGYGVPMLLHYGDGAREISSTKRATKSFHAAYPLPYATGEGGGVSWSGFF